MDYISAYKARFGVEPICEVLNEMEIQIAPSTYYAAVKRPPSARALCDERLVPIVRQVHGANYSCYGVRKMQRALNRLQHGLGRDQVTRLMKMAGVKGRSRLKRIITTKREAGRERYPDLVRRQWIRARRMSCGWRTSRTSGPTKAPCTSPSYRMPAVGASSASLFKAAKTRISS